MYDRSITGTYYFDDVPREDLSLWVKLLDQHSPAYGCKRSLAVYRIQRNSRSRKKIEMLNGQWYMYRKYLEFDLITSLWFISLYALNGIRKYFAIFLHFGRGKAESRGH